MESADSNMGNFVKSLVVCSAFLLLSACAGTEEYLPVADGFTSYESPSGYLIVTPLGFTYAQNAPSREYFYFGYPHNSDTGLRTIELRESESKCSPSLTGTSQMTSLSDANGGAAWGRVDYWDRFPHEVPFDQPQPQCRPGSGSRESSAYALCSEKDGKTVVICISQVTDNPDLAKQIFETFRWTE